MILVLGGAGYIGSHVVDELIKMNKEVIVLDNLSTGFKSSVNESATFIKGDLGNSNIVNSIFNKYKIKAVMHFAASSLVNESVNKPYKYYLNNVSNTINLLNCMVENDVKNFIFSSTAATYLPQNEKLNELSPTNPINPYGKSKLMVEEILKDFNYLGKINFVVLRYFNASGASIDAKIGERHNPETHLIPLVLKHLLGEKNSISVFGTDYNTSDGTCIRDYIHVLDIAQAHIMCLENLISGELNSEIYNLGNGNGYSVKEVISACEEISNKKAIIKTEERRQGDPAILIADSTKINQDLGWYPKYSLQDIIQHAWNFHSQSAKEYQS